MTHTRSKLSPNFAILASQQSHQSVPGGEEKTPTSSAQKGVSTTLPSPTKLAPENFWLVNPSIKPLMSTNEKVSSRGSNNPTPSAIAGENTTLPSPNAATPINFASMLIVALMSTNVKLSSVGSNTPTPPA